ncbi:hypothetical protein A9G42_04595 [Gilliamella sp. Nev6-6]|nr:hypothetical protein A9G42_04595 [Gilliamella apicola]
MVELKDFMGKMVDLFLEPNQLRRQELILKNKRDISKVLLQYQINCVSYDLETGSHVGTGPNKGAKLKSGFISTLKAKHMDILQEGSFDINV